ncbi:MAG TPA: glycosyltransferase family 39 protein [Candidatus Sulfotelmatobacter sp.]|nr:glycosyltransferase family 39 protein [Candidatus Sulfotelmatobacter sp.]
MQGQRQGRGVDRGVLVALVVAGVVAIVHLAVAGRYDAFRNELYFIVCGRHPAFGYVDQPPLVPLLAAATQLFGDDVWLLRLPAVLAAVALIGVTYRFVRDLGGSPVAVTLATVAVAICPLLVGVSTTLTTSSFEPLAWTLVAWLLTRALLAGDRRALPWAGVVAGLAFEAKYGIVIWLIGLAIGLLCTPERRVFRSGALWLGVGIAVVLAAPNVVWQTVHGWPFLAVVQNHIVRDPVRPGAIGSIVVQLFAANVALAPLWLAGVIAPFVRADLARLRFLAIGFVVAVVLLVVTHGKDYYFAGLYPTAFVVGGLACAGLARPLRIGWLVLAGAFSVLLAPVVLPILPPPVLARYLDATRLRPVPDERAAVGAPLTQVFSDEMGWRSLEQSVAAAYEALPPADRARVAILAVDYGEAAAIDVYGAKDGLPPAISGNDQYWLWGPRDHDGSVILHVNGEPAMWAAFCAQSSVVGTFGAPYAMPYENDRPIILCRGLRADLRDTWYRFKRYG